MVNVAAIAFLKVWFGCEPNARFGDLIILKPMIVVVDLDRKKVLNSDD